MTKTKDVQKRGNLLAKGIIRAGTVLLFMGIGLVFESKKGISEQFVSILASTIIAASLAGFSVIYNIDHWSTKKKIAVHTLCMAITVIPALIISGWFDVSSTEGYFAILASFILFGIVGASVGYLVSKHILKNVPEKSGRKNS